MRHLPQRRKMGVNMLLIEINKHVKLTVAFSSEVDE